MNFIVNIRHKVNALVARVRIPAFLKNKYFLTAFFFLIWLCFIDDESFLVQYHLHQQHKDLNKRKQRLEKDITSIKKDIDAYKNNPALLEKHARENYLMKRDNETLYIFIER